MPGSLPHSARRPLCLGILLVWLGACATTQPSGPEIGRLPTITSSNPRAEASLEAARQSRDSGDITLAEKRYAAFVQEFREDPLVAVAELEWGQLLLRRGAYQEARAHFQRVADHRQPVMAEQGRFYEAVAMAHMGEEEEAAHTLRSMVGRTVSPSETGLLLLTLADAEVALDNMEGAAVALNRLLESDSVLPADRQAGEARLQRLLERQATPEQVNRMLNAVPAGSRTYEPILRRALADARVTGDNARIRELIGYFEAASIPLDDDLRALAMQASDATYADPRAVGAILSLSGRTRKVSEYALRGLMLAANLPPQGPMGVEAPRLVFRDDGGEPDRAVKAVDELVNMHRVVAIIGPMDPNAARVAAARAAELEVPLIALSPVSGITDQGDGIFQAFPSARAEVQTLVAYAAAQGKRRIGVLYPENAYGYAMRDLLQQSAQQTGALEMVAEESYSDGETAFGEHISNLVKARVDALFVPDVSDRMALIAPALAASGLWSTAPGQEPPKGGRSVLLLGPSGAYSPTLVNKSGRYLQGAVFTTPYASNDVDEESQAFAANYREQFGSEPNAIAAVAHDAYSLVLAATADGASDRSSMADRLRTQQAPQAFSLQHGLGDQGGPTFPVHLMQLVGDHMQDAPLQRSLAMPPQPGGLLQ